MNYSTCICIRLLFAVVFSQLADAIIRTKVRRDINQGRQEISNLFEILDMSLSDLEFFAALLKGSFCNKVLRP